MGATTPRVTALDILARGHGRFDLAPPLENEAHVRRWVIVPEPVGKRSRWRGARGLQRFQSPFAESSLQAGGLRLAPW